VELPLLDVLDEEDYLWRAEERRSRERCVGEECERSARGVRERRGAERRGEEMERGEGESRVGGWVGGRVGVMSTLRRVICGSSDACGTRSEREGDV